MKMGEKYPIQCPAQGSAVYVGTMNNNADVSNFRDAYALEHHNC
jgi:hypothetical protein